MGFALKVPAEPSLRPNLEAARRLLEQLRELHAPAEIIAIAERTVKLAEQANRESEDEHDR